MPIPWRVNPLKILHHLDLHGELTIFQGWIQRSSIQKYLLLVPINGIFLRFTKLVNNGVLFSWICSGMYTCFQCLSLSNLVLCLAGVCLFSQRETMWTICPCIWMLQIQPLCPMVGVDMHSLAWQLFIKRIISIPWEKVVRAIWSFTLLQDDIDYS